MSLYSFLLYICKKKLDAVSRLYFSLSYSLAYFYTSFPNILLVIRLRLFSGILCYWISQKNCPRKSGTDFTTFK